MATKGPESIVKGHIKQQLKSLSPDCWFFMPVAGMFAVAGIPDFIGLYKGSFFGIEAKSATGKTTALQRLILKCISEAGGMAIVVKGKDQAMTVAQQVVAWHEARSKA